MKLTLTLTVLCLIGLSVYVAKAVDIEDSDTPAFVRSLRLLQRGPPEIPTRGRDNIVTGTIEQKLDHCDENETRTWQMRYMANDKYFKAGGPIFIFLGGEWEISPGAIISGHFVDMAKEHNGYLYYTEHRYYGESQPTSSLTRPNLKYLHIKQALADLAHFIRTIKQTVTGLEKSKVIIEGCSYSATMVVWFKRLYPELMDGGWASSAPILAKVDFREYKEVVGRSYLELGSQACYNRIQNGIAELEDMMDNRRDAEVKAMLKICNTFDVNNDLDVWSVFGSISNIFAGIAQYQRGNDIPNACNYLMDFEDDLSAVANFVLEVFGSSSCLDMSYKSTVEYYLESTYRYGAARPWYYQTCNEYGWYQSSASRNQPFGKKFPALMYTVLCRDVFGDKYTEEFIGQQAAQTNIDFGGMNPEVENVFMTHGALDPWNPMGHGESEGATVIPRASHCADIDSISSDDSDAMRASKERLAELVRGWVSNNSSNVSDKKFAKARKYMRQIVN